MHRLHVDVRNIPGRVTGLLRAPEESPSLGIPKAVDVIWAELRPFRDPSPPRPCWDEILEC